MWQSPLQPNAHIQSKYGDVEEEYEIEDGEAVCNPVIKTF